MRAERKMQFESGEAVFSEQGNPSAPYQLENLPETVLDAVFAAGPADCFFCGVPLYSHGVYPYGFQEK